jgi:hypothetical protein
LKDFFFLGVGNGILADAAFIGSGGFLKVVTVVLWGAF